MILGTAGKGLKKESFTSFLSHLYKDVNKSTNSDAVVSKRFGSRITISNAIIFKDIDPVQREITFVTK